MQKNGEEPGYEAMSYDRLAAASPHNPLCGTTARMEWNGTLDRTSVDTHLGSGQEPLSLSSLTNFRSTSSHLWRRAFSASWEVVSGERREEREKGRVGKERGEEREREGGKGENRGR